MSAPRHYLCLDQGGQSSRALVFNDNGERLAAATRNIATRRDADRIEHDAAAVLTSLHEVVDEITDQTFEFAAAGLACQRSSIVCWDRDTAAPLSPVLSWQDRRGAKMLQALELDPERVRASTGLLASPHYGASKLRWCLDNLPDVQAANRDGSLLGGPLASFLLAGLLREKPALVDPANATRTLLYDRHTGQWNRWLADAFAIPLALLPRCVANRYPFGHLVADNATIPHTVCQGDQSAALFATGRPQTGEVFINMGTGAFIQTVAPDGIADVPSLLNSIVWRDDELSIRVFEGTVNGGAAALKKIGTSLGIDTSVVVENAPTWLATVSNPPLFLNGVSGLGSPFWRADFDSRFVDDGDVFEKMVGVYESICFLIMCNLDALNAAGVGIDKLTVSGGLSRLDGLCQRLADLSHCTVRRPHIGEATARGLAFLLAGMPVEWSSVAEDTFTPESNEGLVARFRRWRGAMDVELRG